MNYERKKEFYINMQTHLHTHAGKDVYIQKAQMHTMHIQLFKMWIHRYMYKIYQYVNKFKESSQIQRYMQKTLTDTIISTGRHT